MNKYAKLKFRLKNYIISSVSGFFSRNTYSHLAEHQWSDKHSLKNAAVPVPKSVNLKLTYDSAVDYTSFAVACLNSAYHESLRNMLSGYKSAADSYENVRPAEIMTSSLM